MFVYASVSAGVAMKLDPQKTGAPISKYLYSRFIEHLGRSVNGGPWAEMAEHGHHALAQIGE